MFKDTTMNGFYPTSPGVVAMLIDGLDLKNKSILDPSAGKGDLLVEVQARLPRYAQSKCYAIEINPELRAVLIDKGFSVVDSDFLQYNGLQYFDYILMNPPFSEGATHLLKAWEISHGAVIRCLLNSETLSNPYTEERRLLVDLVKKHGWSKELGPVFLDAERKTGVNVTLVHLQDTCPREGFRVSFDELDFTKEGFELNDIPENALVSADAFENHEARFNAAIESFKELLQARQKVEYFLEPLLLEYQNTSTLVGDALSGGKTSAVSYQSFLEKSTREAWSSLFSKTKLAAVSTEGVRREIESLQGQQEVMAFTSGNMQALFETLFHNRSNIMAGCVMEAFDTMTKYYDKNREYCEGWKTNSSYKVATRFILPHIGSYYSSGLDYSAARQIEDIEKALCLMSGKPFKNIVSVASLYSGREIKYGKWLESSFFETKLFKKRTMHFRWLNEALRQDFNTLVARERWGQIPEKTKQGVYR